MSDVPREAVHVQILASPGEDDGIPGRYRSPALTGQRPPHDNGPAVRLPVGDEPVYELDEIVGKPYRDLLAHPNTVPHWDCALALGLISVPCASRLGTRLPTMPIVTIEWYEGRSAEQKAELAEKLTAVISEVGKTPPEAVWIRFKDSEKGDWAMGGKLQG